MERFNRIPLATLKQHFTMGELSISMSAVKSAMKILPRDVS
jgi:hypothetical protein